MSVVNALSAASAVSAASGPSAAGAAGAVSGRHALTRREFLQVSASAAGGLVVSLVMPPLAAAEGAAPPKLPAAVNQPLGSFVRIEPDGRIVIGARGCEIGQGVRTSLPMLIAEELDVPWSAVTVEQLPYGLIASPDPPGLASRYGPQGAGGSTSIPDAWHELRQVGARARWLLVQAAAQVWQQSAAALRTEDAQVAHPDGRRLSYARLAQRAAALTPPDGDVPMKDKSAYHIIGHPTRVADGRDIVTGVAAYGIDAALPGALTVLIARCPYFDGSLGELDDSEARRIPGVRQVVTIPPPRAGAPLDRNLAAGVAVIADDFWSAHRGREALRIRWTAGPGAKDSSAALEQRAAAAFGKGGLIARQDGDFAAARRTAARIVERTYIEPFLAHATMEPPNALIDLKANRALLVASLQSPGDASRMINAMTGIPRPDIEIRLPRTGGGFGRRLQNDFVAEAVLVAQKAGVPLKVLWTREDDLQNDFYRPFGVHRLSAALDATGRVTGWSHRVAATARKWRAAGMEDETDWIGCVDRDGFPAGCVENYVAEFLPVDFQLARGWWRAPLPTFAAFPIESFLDEVAHESRQDPLALRFALLGAPRELDYRDHGGPKLHTGRLAEVLRQAARAIGYGRKLPPRHGVGLASHFTHGGYAAHAIEVAVSEHGELDIVRCVCAADVGAIVNPLGLDAQFMGGTVDGLSTALSLEITVKAGRVQQANFPDYPLMRMARAPDVEVHLIESGFPPSGSGEMGIPPVAPALVNAIFAASAVRLRRLPIGAQLKGVSRQSRAVS
jgi:isoquinoline 1-oxidoreductase subunit beta